MPELQRFFEGDISLKRALSKAKSETTRILCSLAHYRKDCDTHYFGAATIPNACSLMRFKSISVAYYGEIRAHRQYGINIIATRLQFLQV